MHAYVLEFIHIDALTHECMLTFMCTTSAVIYSTGHTKVVKALLAEPGATKLVTMPIRLGADGWLCWWVGVGGRVGRVGGRWVSGCIHTRTDHTHTHTYACTHTHTHTHTHTYTYTRAHAQEAAQRCIWLSRKAISTSLRKF